MYVQIYYRKFKTFPTYIYIQKQTSLFTKIRLPLWLLKLHLLPFKLSVEKTGHKFLFFDVMLNSRIVVVDLINNASSFFNTSYKWTKKPNICYFGQRIVQFTELLEFLNEQLNQIIFIVPFWKSEYEAKGDRIGR